MRVAEAAAPTLDGSSPSRLQCQCRFDLWSFARGGRLVYVYVYVYVYV
ncbi:hypothetical protein N8H10_00230 [Curtobacterium flaccumfaciens pv. poinsettiae]|uniref:Uncharacterized protein n=1 Tax=Curtobacterium flaccumfaciens pv. flaccumfaciens TaxID=138532 RepID=A0A9Q2ZRH5_9MICO|nr:hypothetical protein [Curtobacterium flaccumfaciens]MBT1543562.1 hypothetical protein [Curtobacterium flaccumfaciens pv. flaccumfaciens]MCU0151213.1 hypothetical protein [Curtobacterium flaccumfaciens pv. poinsettiae]